jgi:hypothetical protein
MTLEDIATIPALTGVLVSPRDKNIEANILTKIKATSPDPYATRLCEDLAAE